MADWNLDLRAVEEHLDEPIEPGSTDGRVVLGILDGTTDPTEWIDAVEAGNVLVLSVDGDLNELASGFAREIKEQGGHLTHFRGFLVVSPPTVPIDTQRLAD